MQRAKLDNPHENELKVASSLQSPVGSSSTRMARNPFSPLKSSFKLLSEQRSNQYVSGSASVRVHQLRTTPMSLKAISSEKPAIDIQLTTEEKEKSIATLGIEVSILLITLFT